MTTKKQILLIYILLAAAVLLAFWRVSLFDFINYDDPVYITENTHIRHGITAEAIRWAFTTGYASNWHPLTWMSHMLDVQLFGLNPRWHHLTNLLFHIANTLLLFFVFNRMTKSPWKSAFVAALFALHPLHVESVAWVAERKDVLSTFFWMLTMVAYIHYVEHPRLKNYLAILILFALGLMSKPMLVTLPFVLLFLDYWPLQRMHEAGSGKREAVKTVAGSMKREPPSANKKKSKSGKKRAPGSSPEQILRGVELEEKPSDDKYQWALIRPLLREKIPFFALAALSSVVTFIAQQKGGAVQSTEVLTPGVRLANALISYILYIRKMVLPTDLAVLYPHPGLLPPSWQVLGAFLLFVSITFMVIRTAKRLPYLAVGWLWYACTLVPVIGIVQVGSQSMADRYTYVPLIGLFIMAAWGIPEILRNLQPAHSPRKKVLIASSSLVLLSLFVITWAQVGYWKNSISLYDHALNVTSNNRIMVNNRGAAYATLGNYRQAVSDFDRAIEINNRYADAYNNRGMAYGKLGNHREAISDFGRAIAIYPEYALAYLNRGVSNSKLGNYRQAISDFDKTIEINPEYADAYTNRGVVNDESGNHRQAISDFDRAVAINPEYAAAYNYRGVAYGKLANYQQAISNYDKAIEINPEYADAHNNRGVAYGKLGNQKQAIVDFDKAVEINPEYAGAYLNRGVVYRQLGDNKQAISDFDRTIRINPDFAAAYFNRGFAYGKLGNQEQATKDLQKAARLGYEDAKNLLKSQGVDW